jgi:succinylglutamate desuccinylase
MKELYITYTHGNEIPPKNIVEDIEDKDVIVANVLAAEKNVRFIDTDLNRSFGVSKPNSYEEKRAVEIENIMKSYDIVYDIHRTVAPHAKFIALISKKEDYKYTLKFRPNAVVLIELPGATITHCKVGIALEYPMKYTLGKDNPEMYKVIDFVESKKSWVDFQPIKYGKETVYPLMVGETAYDGKCFLLRLI